MHSRSDFDPYEGYEARGWPVLTISRGEVIMRDGQVLGTPGRGLLLSRGRYQDLEDDERAAGTATRAEPRGEPEPGAAVPRERVYELLAHLVASAEICVVEPHYYGSFRLLDAASKLAAIAARLRPRRPMAGRPAGRTSTGTRWLMMSDRPAFYDYLPQASRQVAQRLLQTAA